MAHQLTQRASGKVEMGFLAGTDRWHGLGNELVAGATIEQWIEAAGMDWSVQRSKVRYTTERGGDAVHTWDDNHVLFRSDTKAPLGLVSDSFKVVQPREVLEFFRDLCETNDFQLRTAGTLFGGKRFWALADIGQESFVLDPKDRVKGRLLLVTACDGSLATKAKFISECVVCNNTLTMGLREDGKQISVSHRSVFDANDAKAKLGLADGQFGRFIGDLRRLADRKISLVGGVELTERLLTGKDGGDLTVTQRDELYATRGFKRITELFTGGAIASELDGRGRTAWGWLNAVTEYADHHVSARNADNRFNSSQFGAGERLKNDALAIALSN